MDYKKRIFIQWLTLLLLNIMFGQQLHKSERNADIIEYTHKEGLPTTQFNTIKKTDDGYIWLSGREGTYRFDGYSFAEVAPGLGLPQMQSLFYDSTAKRLYFASPEKFIIFDGAVFTAYSAKEGYRVNGLPGQIINFIKKDSKGRIWIGSETPFVDRKNNGGLTLFENNTFTAFDSSVFPLDNASNLLETPYGDLIISSSGRNTQTGEGSYIALYKDGVFKRIDESAGVLLQDANFGSNLPFYAIDNEGNTWMAFRGVRNVGKVKKTAGILMYDGKLFHQYPGLVDGITASRFPFSVFYSKTQKKIFVSMLFLGGHDLKDSRSLLFELNRGRWQKSGLLKTLKSIKNLRTQKTLKNFRPLLGIFSKKTRFFPETFTLFPSAPTRSSQYPNQLFTLKDGKSQKYEAFIGAAITETDKSAILSTSKGFAFYYPNQSKMLTAKDGLLLTQSGIPDLYADRRGIVWIAYSYTATPAYANLANSGINIWDGKKLHKMTTDDGLPSNVTFDFYQDKNDRVWIPTARGFATARELLNSDGDWIFKVDKIPSDGKYNYNVTNILELSNGSLYALQNFVRPASPGIKTEGDIRANIGSLFSSLTAARFYFAHFDGSEFKTIASPFDTRDMAKTYQVFRMQEGLKGGVWLQGMFANRIEDLASAPGNFKIYDGEEWSDPKAEWHLPEEQLHYVGRIKEKDYYLTVDGFYEFDGSRFINLIDSVNADADFTLLKGASVAGTHTEIEAGGRLYIRLRGKGLAVFDGKSLEFITRKKGLPDANLSNPNTDEKGRLFFGTPSGALVIEDGKFLPYYSDEQIVSGGSYVTTLDRNNDLVLFYNGVGLYIAKMENRQFNLKITSLRVNEKDYFYFFPTDLPYDKNSFVFNYSAFNFKNPRQTLYEHKLDGYDLNWSRSNNLSFSEYQNLPHGSYNFRVKGVTANGVATHEANYAFTINPPLWQAWYAYLSYVGLFGLMLLSIRKYEKRRLRLKEAEKRRREKNEARLRESELKARAAEMQAKAAEAQNRAIQAENDRKSKELEEARALQLSLLPKDVPVYQNLVISTYMKTATEVGGDYYDFSFKKDGTLNVAIGDATGHGMKAGTLVTAMKALFSSGSTEVEMAPFFASVNMGLKKMQMERVMMGLAMLNFDQNKVKLINAGMPPILLYRKKTAEVEEIKEHGMPLGAMEKVKYQATALSLAAGDTLLLMTDGMPELQNETGEMFGYERIAAHFKQTAENSPEEIITQLKDAGSQWVDDRDPDDDVTFVVIKMR